MDSVEQARAAMAQVAAEGRLAELLGDDHEVITKAVDHIVQRLDPVEQHRLYSGGRADSPIMLLIGEMEGALIAGLRQIASDALRVVEEDPS